ncbi:MAG: S1 RNA-binding domain-containing protein [Muribaculaceae bacterium]
MSIELGKINTLTVKRKVDFGLYLGPEEGTEEVLMPRRYTLSDMQIGDKVDVFVYNDSEDRMVATTEKPLAMVGEFALLRVKSVSNVGAFLDWGLMKDLLVPFREQKVRMMQGRWYIVYVYVDDNSQRIVASAKIDKFLDNTIAPFKPFDEVDLLVAQRTDLGFKVIINNLFSGMIYHNQIFQDVNIGERLKGYINTLRRDGKIDVMLGQVAKSREQEIADSILSYLARNRGTMRITDASSPEEIRVTFKCSKKDFKKALGHLYRQHLIDLSDKTCVRQIKG